MKNFKECPRLDVFKSSLVKDAYFSNLYEFPLLKKSEYKPKTAIPFDKIRKTSNYEQWVHFYIFDCNFQSIWNNPKQYLNLLKKFKGVITPDFSIYRELPLAMQIWNTYRNRAIGYYLQSNDISIVPNVRWGDERTYEFAFEGLEKGGTFAISTNGAIQNKTNRYYFEKGLAKMVEVLKPEAIINYSQTPDDIFKSYRDNGIEIINIENYALTVRRKGE